MFEIGRLCVKTAGRDAMEFCVIVDVIDDNFVLIEGNTRRKKVNKRHLEPLETKLNVKKGASRDEVLEAFKNSDLPIKKRGEPKKEKPQIKKDRSKKKDDKKKDKK